ncbi:hypothetical protein [Escherichia coli]|uniref:terminase small subunit-like protein n=1 Tax=Escherichia coli TaxID=562 RepID=UPI001FF37CE7|nr:hypothetical protein [Escherichia coli]
MRRKRGRPTLDSEQLRQKIGSHILDGLNLHQIAKLPDMPGYRTLTRWMATKPEFSEWVRQLQLDYEEERHLQFLEDLGYLDDEDTRDIGRILRSFRTSTRA